MQSICFYYYYLKHTTRIVCVCFEAFYTNYIPNHKRKGKVRNRASKQHNTYIKWENSQRNGYLSKEFLSMLLFFYNILKTLTVAVLLFPLCGAHSSFFMFFYFDFSGRLLLIMNFDSLSIWRQCWSFVCSCFFTFQVCLQTVHLSKTESMCKSHVSFHFFILVFFIY